MAPMTQAERQRRYREKLKTENPDKFERMKKENAERTKKRYIGIKKLPDALKDKNRKRWREQKKKIKKRVSFLEIPKYDRSTEKQKRKVRSLLSEENSKLKARVAKMARIVKRQRQTISRYQKKMGHLQDSLEKLEKELQGIRESNENIVKETKDTTPYSKTEKLLQETVPNISSPDKKRVKKAIFEGYVLKQSLSNQYLKAKSRSDKAVMKNVINNDIVKKYKLKTEFSYSCLGLKGKLRQRKMTIEKKKIKTMKEIQSFLERDDNSRITAGKKETRTEKKEKRQVRYLLDSMVKLHKKYKEEGGLASYTVFTRYKPYYIVDPKITQRNTCACVKHANLTFLAQKLKVLGVLETADLDELVSAVVCDKFNEKCMYNECKNCANKTISFNLPKSKTTIVSWNAWVTKTHEYVKNNKGGESNTLKTKRTTKDVIEGTLESLIKSFNDQLEKFKKHYFNIYHAYQMYKNCKETMTETECIIHCDFSENYGCKSNEEVQAMHFGASKLQFTLHTGVIYYRNGQNLQEKSFCTISPNNNHGPIAIWAHLTPVLEYIKNTYPKITTVHFFSDGPTTQYRQKGNFYLMSEMIKQMGLKKSTWSFFESAHGKGAADGVGGAVKRTLDRQVTFGKDIVDAQTAFEILQTCQSKIMYFYVTDENIKAIEQKTDLTGLIPVPSTMEIHQIITTDRVNIIKYRKLACFCKKTLCECFGLEEHDLKTKKQKRKLEEKKGQTSKTTKRQCIEKPRTKLTEKIDSDTSIESHITYADSDGSAWKPGDELNSEDECDDTESKENYFMDDNNTAKNCNTKVKILSEVRNTPENLRYFNLKNYGTLTLKKVNIIQGLFSQDRQSLVNNTIDDKREEVEDQSENYLSPSVRTESEMEKKKITLGEEKSVIVRNDSEEYSLSQRTKEVRETRRGNSIPSSTKQKCSVSEIEIHTEIESKETKEDAIEENYSKTKGRNYSGIDKTEKNNLETKNLVLSENETEIEESPTMQKESVIVRNDSEEYSLSQRTKEVRETRRGNSISSSTKQKCSVSEIEIHTEIEPKETKNDAIEENNSKTKGRNYSEIDKTEKNNLVNKNLISENETEGEELPTMQKETIHVKYNVNDSVLVRYYQKKSWMYYIGFIENVKDEEDMTYYDVNFLKTMKKPNLKFVTPKKIDKDTVPTECVVKSINLNVIENGFVLSDSGDHIYFS